MKSRNYSRRPTLSLHTKRRPRRRKSIARFFLKLFILLALVAGVLAGGWWCGRKVCQWVAQTHFTQWHAKTIVVDGVTGDLQKALFAQAAPFQNKPFTIQDAVVMRNNILHNYPMLTNVSVKRGLFSGKLTVFAQHRVPLAKFVLPNGKTRYIDADSTVYDDPHPNLLTVIPSVELLGQVPEKLNGEFMDLVESTLKLNKELNFSLLQMNFDNNTVTMRLPDGNEIDFGAAVALKKKAGRAAQIVALARKKYPGPFRLSFQFFEQGRVFLTQIAPEVL